MYRKNYKIMSNSAIIHRKQSNTVKHYEFAGAQCEENVDLCKFNAPDTSRMVFLQSAKNNQKLKLNSVSVIR